ncbi:MAG: hypothetical protein AAGG11_06110 [Pseudomonadota bacterium]
MSAVVEDPEAGLAGTWFGQHASAQEPSAAAAVLTGSTGLLDLKNAGFGDVSRVLRARVSALPVDVSVSSTAILVLFGALMLFTLRRRTAALQSSD